MNIFTDYQIRKRIRANIKFLSDAGFSVVESADYWSRCHMCKDQIYDIFSSYKEISPIGEEFDRFKYEAKVCARCSNLVVCRFRGASVPYEREQPIAFGKSIVEFIEDMKNKTDWIMKDSLKEHYENIHADLSKQIKIIENNLVEFNSKTPYSPYRD